MPLKNIGLFIGSVLLSISAVAQIPNGGFETNFRLIYLLLYQNLPNRINKITYVPPVIYRALLPGVFSYRWSYISNLEIKMIRGTCLFH